MENFEMKIDFEFTMQNSCHYMTGPSAFRFVENDAPQKKQT